MGPIVLKALNLLGTGPIHVVNVSLNEAHQMLIYQLLNSSFILHILPTMDVIFINIKMYKHILMDLNTNIPALDDSY